MGFLLLVFLVYYLIPRKFQWQLLLAASYVFYFLADPRYLFYILLTTISTWGIGVLIDNRFRTQKEYLAAHKAELSKEERKAYKQRTKQGQWRLLLTCLLFNLGILAILKYTNFTIANINGLLHFFGSDNQLSMLNIVLPLGISFYTFQSLGYIIDVYRGTAQAERNFFRFALFVSFFPQLIQGPISRWNDLSASLYEEHAFDWQTVSFGLQRILWGYFKKMVIADRMLTAVNTIIRNSDQYQGAYVFAGMLFYALELYADFTGGIDITIGIAQVMGIRVTENFHRPYFSKSIKEYWRRWHITLSLWLRDYLYIPLGGSRRGNRYLNLIITMALGGLWHGSNIRFLVWGVMHGVGLAVVHAFHELKKRFWPDGFTPSPALHWCGVGAAWLLTFHFVSFLWVFFRAEDMERSLEILRRVFVFGQPGEGFPLLVIPAVLIGLALQFFGARLFAAFVDAQERLPWAVQAVVLALVGGFILKMGPDGVMPFIYFQF